MELAALNLLSRRIAQKTASNLEPIQEPDVITEIQPVIDALNQLLARLQRALVAEQRFTAGLSLLAVTLMLASIVPASVMARETEIPGDTIVRQGTIRETFRKRWLF